MLERTVALGYFRQVSRVLPFDRKRPIGIEVNAGIDLPAGTSFSALAQKARNIISDMSTTMNKPVITNAYLVSVTFRSRHK